MSAAWEPDPMDLWLVHGTMGGVAHGVGEHGVDSVVLLRVASVNGRGDEADVTYAMDLEDATTLLNNLMTTATQAWGRAAMQAAMARTLGVPDGLRDATVKAVEDALDGLDQ